MANIFYDRTNDAGSGARYDRTNDAASATGIGVTDNASAPSGIGIGYAVVTLADPIYTGQGSIAQNSNFVGTAVAGDTVRYPTTNGFMVFVDGTIQADTNNGSYVCYYNDGTGEVAFTITINNTAYAIGAGVTDTTSAPSGAAIGGAPGSASGTGVTDTATAPAGTAQAGVTVTGTGTTDTAAAPIGSAAGSAAAGGTGITDTATAADGNATGGAPGSAVGAGVTDNTTAPNGTVTGGAIVAGAGITDTTTAPAGTAAGGASGSAIGTGVTDSVAAPMGAAQGGAAATSAGVTDTATPAQGNATVFTNPTGNGVNDNATAPDATVTGGASTTASGTNDEAAAPQGHALGGQVGIASGEGFKSTASAPTAAVLIMQAPTYCSQAEMITRFGLTEMTQLTDRNNTGLLDEAVLNVAMSSAEDMINGYLEGRYGLPLTIVPRILVSYACDIARYFLYDDRATEQVTKRYDDAIKFLTKVAQGLIALGVDPQGKVAPPAGGPTVVAPDRIFTQDTLKDFQ